MDRHPVAAPAKASGRIESHGCSDSIHVTDARLDVVFSDWRRATRSAFKRASDPKIFGQLRIRRHKLPALWIHGYHGSIYGANAQRDWRAWLTVFSFRPLQVAAVSQRHMARRFQRQERQSGRLMAPTFRRSRSMVLAISLSLVRWRRRRQPPALRRSRMSTRAPRASRSWRRMHLD